MSVKPEAFLALESSLALRLSSTFGAVTKGLFVSVQAALDSGDWAEASSLVESLDLEPVYSLNEDYILYVSRLSVLFGASRVTKSPGTSAVGLGFDKLTVEQYAQTLHSQIVYGLQPALIDDALQLIALRKSKVEEDVSGEAYLGAVLKADKPSILRPFASFMGLKGKAAFNMVSSLHTSRLSAFGYCAEADALGVTEYRINEQLDNRICPVCSFMHGKVFRVSDAKNFLDVVVRTQDPGQLKSLQPWPKQNAAALQAMKAMSSDELVSNGWHVPPFHPRCRGLLSQAHKVVGTGKLSAVEEPVDSGYVASAEDFNQLGIKLSPAKVSLWNALVNTSPAEVIARLSGKATSEVLSLLATSETPQASLGLANLSVTSTGVNLELQAPVYGSKFPVVQDYYFRKDKSLFVGSIKVAQGDESVYKPVLRSLYGVAKATPMESIAMISDSDISGYAWAKYGLTPSPSQWKSILRQVKVKASAPGALDAATEMEKKALEAILKSTDPDDIFALSDLPNIGKPLLQGTTWMGSLDLESEEATARFLLMIGGKS